MRESINYLRCDFLCPQDTQRERTRSGKPVLISILAFSLVFHAINLSNATVSEKTLHVFRPLPRCWIRGIVCGAIHGSWSEMSGNGQTDRQTHTTTTVTLAAHACRGLMNKQQSLSVCSADFRRILNQVVDSYSCWECLDCWVSKVQLWPP